MLISARYISKILKIRPSGVVHVGAHQAEERQEYAKNKWGNTCWIEAIPENVELIKNKIMGSNDMCIQALVHSEIGKKFEFNITSNTQSSSIYELGTHAIHHPEIVVERTISLFSQRLDGIIPSNFEFNFINFDIQGAELEAIKSLGNFIDKVDYIYTEVNREPLYIGCAVYSEVERYLNSNGFEHVVTKWTNAGWGDAIFARKNKIDFKFRLRKIFLKFLISNSANTFHLLLKNIVKI